LFIILVGLQFCKVPSRRIFAVRLVEAVESRKRQKTSTEEYAARNFDEIKTEVNSLKNKIDNVQESISRSAILKEKVKEFLRCTVCLDTARNGNIYVSSCCQVAIGCVGCIDRWLQDNSLCPHCRAAQFITIKLKGFEGLDLLLE